MLPIATLQGHRPWWRRMIDWFRIRPFDTVNPLRPLEPIAQPHQPDLGAVVAQFRSRVEEMEREVLGRVVQLLDLEQERKRHRARSRVRAVQRRNTPEVG